MGIGGSTLRPHVLASCDYPPYCAKMLGSSHILVAGGGGASKTGIKNRLDGFLFQMTDGTESFDKNFNIRREILKLHSSFSVETEARATMNLDVISIDPINGRYLIAAGQDDQCVLYTTDFDVKNEENDQGIELIAKGPTEIPASDLIRLTFAVRQVRNFRTDFHPKSAYQKVVRFDPSCRGLRLVTGGADGHFRIWDTETGKKLVQIHAYTNDVDDLDVSRNGKFLVTVGHSASTVIWRMIDGQKVVELPQLERLGGDFRVRSCRFTTLGEKNVIFVTAHSTVQRGAKKQTSFLVLWALNVANKTCRSIVLRPACDEPISTLNVSNCGNFTGIGTMSGSVGIFDTHEMRPLLFHRATHDIFVTGVEFVSSSDDLSINSALDSRTAVVSISADQTVQFHTVPYSDIGKASFSWFVVVVFGFLLAFLMFFHF